MKAVQVIRHATARAFVQWAHIDFTLHRAVRRQCKGVLYFFLAAAESSSRLRDLSTSEANFWKVSSDT